ncbi:ankyrin repeat domain-containing protein [Wolbachia endosymbiont of Ctenocephalides felis wCfeT]|uniref:ankyrin repeat domain-containing protein n=1 Tax=Wolbachia endosymbiont of Ctenocephalides felis wCfeT TaxID=2732593 RepID=UPI00350F50AE
MRKFCELLKELKEKQFQEINSKDEKGNTILHLAAEYASGETIKLLIEKGADINAKNDKGETPLHRAAHKGKVRNVRGIIKTGCDINARDNELSTPLHHAVMALLHS